MNMFNEQVTVIPKPDINLNLEWTYHCPRITKDTEFMNSNEWIEQCIVRLSYKEAGHFDGIKILRELNVEIKYFNTSSQIARFYF